MTRYGRFSAIVALIAVLAADPAPAVAAARPLTLPPNTWVKLSEGQFNFRRSPGFVHDPADDKLYVIGGEFESNTPRRYDVISYDLASREWHNELPFEKIGIWGDRLGQVHAPDMGDDWVLVDPEGVVRPNFRVKGGSYSDYKSQELYDQFAYDTDEHDFYVHVYNTFLRYNTRTRVWERLPTAGGPFSTQFWVWGSMEYDKYNKEILLFGGSASFPEGTPGTWVYEIAERRWRKLELATEPGARANTRMVYDDAHDVIVLFGGDGLDRSLSDTWVYDPRTRTWRELEPDIAPSPRSIHAMVYLPKSRKIAVLGGQRAGAAGTWGAHEAVPLDLWIYDYATNTWSFIRDFGRGGGYASADGHEGYPKMIQSTNDDVLIALGASRSNRWRSSTWAMRIDTTKIDAAGTRAYGVAPGTQRYRTGTGYDPDWLAAVRNPQLELSILVPNKWAKAPIARLPIRNRAWGATLYVPDTDEIIRWSGGHSAHGGNDVLHYDIDQNCWTQGYWAEFPPGWVAAAGIAPLLWSFKGRPAYVPHTYKLYTYDRAARKMVYLSPRSFGKNYVWLYDVFKRDWEFPPTEAPFAADLTAKIVDTAHGPVAWVRGLWLFDTNRKTWTALGIASGRLPRRDHDNSGAVYDPLRDRLLIASSAGGGRARLWQYVFSTRRITELNPGNGAILAAGSPRRREIIHIPTHDVFLFTARIEIGGRAGILGYDPADNAWFGVPVDDSAGAGIYSLAASYMYDPRRDLIWVVNAKSEVFALRLEIDPAARRRPSGAAGAVRGARPE